jgi:Domain of unknown function (DUF4249)
MPKTSLIFIFSILFIGSCVDPLKFNIDEEVRVLIVEGAITTQPGPHYFSLWLSAKYGSILESYSRPVENAKLIIRDSDGENYDLKVFANGPGIYYTDASFLPVVGKSYTLLITTKEGIKYTSLPEKIIKAPEAINISAVFSKTPLAKNKFISGLKIYASWQDDPADKNYHMFRNNGTYQTFTFVSGCCSTCWVDETSADRLMRLYGDDNSNGNQVIAQAAFIEDDGMRFSTKYMVRIEQHTISREAFQYFKLLKEQISIDGDVFDPPPATLRGNMINLSNPDENVIGYFRASDVRINSLFLTPDMMAEVRPLKQVGGDCRKYRRGTIVRPDYW